MNNSFFHYLETSSRAERDEIADNLKAHYNHLVYIERDAFERTFTERSAEARTAHIAAVDALGHVQAVFDILGIEYELGQPFDLGLF